MSGMNSSNVDPRLLAASQRFAENLARYPQEEQFAVSVISKNVLNGCSWEFVRKSAELSQVRDALKANPNCDVKEVTYNHRAGITGYLVYMNLSYLCKILTDTAPGLLEPKDLEKASEHRKEAILSLAKKIQSGYRGKIGIFCTNDSQTITVDGKTFPAYAVSLNELLQIVQRFGYGVVMDGAVRNASQVLQREDYVLKKLVVAPSSNALFIDIAPL